MTYRHHPVMSITRSAVPAANPDATVTFPRLSPPRPDPSGDFALMRRAGVS